MPVPWSALVKVSRKAVPWSRLVIAWYSPSSVLVVLLYHSKTMLVRFYNEKAYGDVKQAHKYV